MCCLLSRCYNALDYSIAEVSTVNVCYNMQCQQNSIPTQQGITKTFALMNLDLKAVVV